MGSVTLNIGEGTARFRRASIFSSTSHLVMLFSVLITNMFALYSFTSSSPRNSPPPSSPYLYPTFDSSSPSLSGELSAFLRRHPLPLGKDSRTGITEMVSSVPHSCVSSLHPLSIYMKYTVASPCPDLTHNALLSSSCRPLPKRRCFSKTIPKPGLLPFPSSLWNPVHPSLLSWTHFSCTSFSCLARKNPSLFSRFNITHPLERRRFLNPRRKNDFSADHVLGLAKAGIRVAVDLAVGAGTFAAVMAEKGVTVVTVSEDDEAPYNEFIAVRGLFPLMISINQRFPFFDGVFDMVHVGTELAGGGGAREKMEFLMFDVDRVLRAGGLLWVDNFWCESEEKKRGLTRLIEQFGFIKLRWVVGERFDAGVVGKKPEVYLSAVLQKPVRV